MKKIPFTKMHGIGNDFLLLNKKDLVALNLKLSKKFIKRICNRNFGIGSDGLLILDESEAADYKYTMYNPDGSYAEMCGNGIRCFMKYLHEEKITNKTKISVETGAGILQLESSGKDVIVDMGVPGFDKKSIGISQKASIKGVIKSVGRQFKYLGVSTGNPHAIIFIEEDLAAFNVAKYGKSIESNTDIFENKINVSFVEKVNDTEINHRVYERGAGETLACGTAVAGTIAVAIKQGILKANTEIKVNLRAGILYMKWSGNLEEPIIMRGPVEVSMNGLYCLKDDEAK